jgi:hypothetical protein
MQTVTFQCGHCGKLMGVSSNFLGQQVRCPHCQQVVLAPASAGPAPPPPAPTPTPTPVVLEPTMDLNRTEHEDIFGPPSATDDLFESPSRPRMELPPTLAPSSNPEDSPPASVEVHQLSETGFPSSIAGLESTQSYLPESVEPTMAPQGPGFLAGDSGTMAIPRENGAPSGTSGVIVPAPEAAPRTQLPRYPAGGSLGFWILILSLISYSVLATIFVVILLLKQQVAGPTNLLRELPDVDGDNPGGQKKKVSWKVDERLHRLPIPSDQRVGLNKTIQVGDLEITPRKIERKTVRVFVENWRDPEKCNGPSLVMHLRLRNVSGDFCFAPLDNYFDRHYTPKSGDTRPLTCLEVGSKTFYGGPANWYPRDRNPGKRLNREWVEGRKDVLDLVDPGKAIDTFVCTDGNDERVSLALSDYKGPLLWRVHVRRGLVRVRGKDVPATAVIGIPFSERDIVEAD